MPLDPNATIVLSALKNTPAFTHGVVRDARVRWALEKIGRPYRAELFEGMTPRPDDYREWQPFGQVPALRDGDVQLFETGAILLYLGEQDERLLPREPQARWAATSWLVAALNSVEPPILQIVLLDIFYNGQDWTKAARPAMLDFTNRRLGDVAKALGDHEWLTGRFTIADIMMVTVLRQLRHIDIVARFPNLAAYQARGEARPAFRQAIADQERDLGPPIPMGER